MSEKILSCDTVIVGAGTAGLEAYKAAVAAGAHCVLVESGPLGTGAKRTGNTPIVVLLSAARKCYSINELSRYGIKTNFELSLNVDQVLNHVRAVRAKDTSEVLSFIYQVPEQDRVIGKATFIDAHNLETNNGYQVNFKTAVIATGSAPVVPYELSKYGVAGGVYTTNEFFDLDQLPPSMAIFGSNCEGLQIGQALAFLGVKVVVFGQHHIWKLSDDSVIESTLNAFQKRFDLVLDGFITSVEKSEYGFEIYYLDASNYENVLTVDSILAASMRYPKLDGLNVRALGLALDQQGCIRVNPRTMQTSLDNIFAAGEVTKIDSTIADARHDGDLAGHNAAVFPHASMEVEPSFNIKILQTDPELAQVGMSYDEVKLRAKGGEQFVASEVRMNDGIFRLNKSNEGTLRLYCDVRSHMILGAEMCMYRASHIAHLIGMAIMQKLTIEQVADMTFFSPSYEEVVQQACQLAIKNLARKDQSYYQ